MTHTLDFQIPYFQLIYINTAAHDLQDIELFEDEINQLESITNPKRKIEFLGVRLLRNSLNIKEKISYKTSGRPFFLGAQCQISITHCQDFVAFATSQEAIGIDMELEARDISSVISKFTSSHEKILYSGATSNWAIELWCAKEAVYKLFDIPGLAFREEICVKERSLTHEFVHLTGEVCTRLLQKDFVVKIKFENELVIAVAQFK
ncbi:MAG: hypothetical protein RLZZ211_110 [Bacteroidota bacterium]|jgi:4'-phosphopantetheinyl transferase EntD